MGSASASYSSGVLKTSDEVAAVAAKEKKKSDPALEPSLYIFSISNPIRKIAIKIAESAEFRWTVLGFILVR
jgi:hypothetical protein